MVLAQFQELVSPQSDLREFLEAEAARQHAQQHNPSVLMNDVSVVSTMKGRTTILS
jgi:hypothetical protein